ncbi:MAG: histidine phosphatase family protein [Rhodobacteraceae bacterium]|nr:histidine phosphatase family protein [Paracoccaceae bacterium]
MSLTLILTRHAKSSWQDPSLDDFDRPLNDRGRKSAGAVGTWLAGHDLVPGEVILSGARRTVDTWSLIAEHLEGAVAMHSDPALYHASAQSMLSVAQTGSARTLMLIGHNPGIADFAARLVAEAPDHPQFDKYPTCATLVLGFEAKGWKDIGWGDGQVRHFVVPRELG